MTDTPEFNPAERPQGEVVQHEPASSVHSLARRIALQILYEVDSAGHEMSSVTSVHLNARQVDRRAARYVRQLVTGVSQHRAVVDKVISQFAPDWPLDQMAIVDRNILRMAIYEFAVQGTAPTGVAIDEAVQLAKLYGAESTPGFVNGVLGAISDDKSMVNSLRVPDAAEDNEDDES